MLSAPYRGRSYWQVLTAATPLAAAIHVVMSVVFQYLGAVQLAIGHLALVGLWITVYWLLRERHNTLATALTWFAVPVHSLVATEVLGWDCGFHYYTVVMVPLVFVSPGKQRWPKVLLAVALGSFYIALDAHARHVSPSVMLEPGVLALLRAFAMATTFGMLAYMANAYFSVVGAAERQLRALATTDVLTGLANRRRIVEVAEQAIARARRDATPLCFMLGDVDHFKQINDCNGHETGDHVLTQVATVLCASLRDVDTVARWGGEEFLVVLPGTTLAGAMHVAERTRRSVEGNAWPLARPVTMTIGVSQWRDGETLAEAVARADEALYRGKDEGRNRSCVEQPAESA